MIANDLKMRRARIVDTKDRLSMTDVEMREWAAKQEWRFTGYYKYVFTFVAISSDGLRGEAEIGADRDDIYRYHVTAEAMTWNGVADGGLRSLTITYPDGHEDEYTDW